CGKALATHPHAPRVQIKFQAEFASEFATAVAKHADATVHTKRPAPSAHDEGVIDGYAPDFIHAFFPQGVTKFQKTWNVFFRACGCKGSRYGKSRDGLALGRVGDLHRVGSNGTCAAGFVVVLVQGAVGN